MAVAYDASSESHTGTTGSTSADSFSWTHTPVGTPRGVLVYTFTNANADDAIEVSYGSWPMTPVSGGRAVDTATEPGDCKAWFLSGYSLTPQSAWAPVTIGNATDWYWGVAQANGYWAVCGLGGRIYYKQGDPAGTWSAATSGLASDLWDIAYGNGYWVLVADGGAIRYKSGDPTGSWSGATSGVSTQLLSVAYGNGYWVAVGAGGVILYATDPTGSWSSATSGTALDFCAVTYGNGYWVAVGAAGVIRYATDPTGSWSSATSGVPSGAARDVAYGNGYWVLVADGGAIRYKSGDPTGSWSGATSGVSNASFWSVEYGNGVWVVMGTGDPGGIDVVRVATNPSGTWSGSKIAGSGSTIFSGLCYSNGFWLTAGEAGRGRFAAERLVDLPTGAQTVIVTRNNNANVMYAVAVTVTASYGTEVTGISAVSADASGGTMTLAQASINDGSPGTNSLRLGGVNSGLSGIVTNAASPGSNNLSSGASSTWAQSIDFGSNVAGVVYETTAGQGARSVGFSSSTADDAAAVYLAIREAIVPWTVGNPIR